MYTTAPRMANSTIMIHNRINLFVAILEKKKKPSEMFSHFNNNMLWSKGVWGLEQKLTVTMKVYFYKNISAAERV